MQGSIPTIVKNAVATKQPLCVDGIRKLCETNKDFDRYEKMQRYMDRRAAAKARSAAGGTGQSLPAPDPPLPVHESVTSPSELVQETDALAATAAAASAEDSSDRPPELDTNKLMLLDPCIYNLKAVSYERRKMITVWERNERCRVEL